MQRVTEKWGEKHTTPDMLCTTSFHCLAECLPEMLSGVLRLPSRASQRLATGLSEVLGGPGDAQGEHTKTGDAWQTTEEQ